MRASIVLLTGLFCLPLAAQQRVVTFVLDDGLRIEGPVLEFDPTRIVVEVGGEPRAYPTSRMRECKFRIVAEEGAASSQKPDPAAADPVPAVEPRPSRAKRTADIKSRLEASGRRASPWRMRTAEMQEEYPWLVPTEPYQWASLGVTLFALLSLFSHFAAKLSGAEQPGFGRAMGLSFALLLALCADFALVGARDTAMGLAAALTLALVPILHRACFRLSMPGTLLASSLFGIQAAFGYAVLRLIDTMFRSMGVGAA